jgi:Pro-kumamolisin, activation domain
MGMTARHVASHLLRRATPSRSRHRDAVLGAVVAATALAMVAATVPAAMADSAPTPAPTRVGAAPHLPSGATRTAAPAAGTPIDLGVVLAPRDPAGLKTFIAGVSTPGSPLYHHYLKTGRFGPAFGATAATVERVRGALEARGLKPGPLAADGLTLPVHTTVGAAGKALRTGFTGYRDREGRTGVTNTAAPALRGDVAPAVATITGLTTTPEVRPHFTVDPHKIAAPKAPKTSKAAPEAAKPASGTAAPRINGKTPTLCGNVSSLAADVGWQDTQQFWSPRSLAGAYGMVDQPNVGTGVTVGVFELENYDTKDIASYQSCYGTKVPVSAVKVDGGPKVAPDGANFGVESALDIEDLIGLVPQASLVVYQGPDATDADGNPVATYQNILDVYQKMVDDDRAQVISTSWGGCERDTLPAFMDAENLIFQQAAAQGQTVTAAAGDSGSADCWPDQSANSSTLSADDPAGQPYVLGVGGTTMTGSGGTNQVTWNDGESATGGGVSERFALDDATGYQAGVNGPGYADGCAPAAGQKCRQVPDVAALADWRTGYLIADGQDGDAQEWGRIGGTSGASPTWAALIAQADLDESCAADGPVGFVNPALYQLPTTAYRDITDGDNYLSYTDVQPAGSYTSVGSGYDLATGLGTPHARGIIPALCKAVPQAPAGTFTSVNPARILDTRAGIGRSGTTPVKANTGVALQVTGSAGGAVPSSGVTAVVLNTTAVAPSAGGHLTAYPDGTTRPTSSNLNWVTGRTVPNLVIVPVGADGKVDLFNASAGTVHFVADLFGYFSTAPGGATFDPVGPARVLDTRAKIGVGTTTPVKANASVALKIAGAGGVPATGATAVVLNVTATASTTAGHLIAYPSGTAQPTSSNINWSKGQTVPNLVVVPVGADGKVDLVNASSGTVHFIADVFGYYGADGAGAVFHAAGPSRLLDTRSGVGAPKAAALTSTGSLSLNLNDGNVLAGAKAVVLNVTVTAGSVGSHLTVWPDGQTMPTSSNLNWTQGQTIANLVTVPVVDGKVDFHVNAGSVAVIADLFGYYT